MTPLKGTDLDHSHYVRLRMTAHVPAGTTLEDVTNPAFWANHAYRFKRGAFIEVLSEDNTLDCELRVLEVGPTFATVRVLRNYVPDMGTKAAPAARPAEDVEVNYGGKNDRWRVMHRGEVVHSGFETRVDAAKAADEYRSKLAA
jgi:hypothetical protein